MPQKPPTILWAVAEEQFGTLNHYINSLSDPIESVLPFTIWRGQQRAFTYKRRPGNTYLYCHCVWMILECGYYMYKYIIKWISIFMHMYVHGWFSQILPHTHTCTCACMHAHIHVYAHMTIEYTLILYIPDSYHL